jgi:hypothetical protein
MAVELVYIEGQKRVLKKELDQNGPRRDTGKKAEAGAFLLGNYKLTQAAASSKCQPQF